MWARIAKRRAGKNESMHTWRTVIDELMHHRDAKRVERRRRSMGTSNPDDTLHVSKFAMVKLTNNQLERAIEARRRGHIRREVSCGTRFQAAVTP